MLLLLLLFLLLLLLLLVVVLTPPTKEGKNNGHRQTNDRTVYIIKYIIFLTVVALKQIRFKTCFYGTKRPIPTP